MKMLGSLSLLKGDQKDFWSEETKAVQAGGYSCPSVIKECGVVVELWNPHEFNDILVVSEMLPL